MKIDDITLPFSDDSERGLLSCILQWPTLLLQAQLDLADDHFHHGRNRLIFQTLKVMGAEGRPLELPSVATYFINAGLADKIGGVAELADLYGFLPTHSHYDYYRGILADKLKVREVIAACTETLKEAMEAGNEDPAKILSRASERFYEITRQAQSKGMKTFKTLMDEYVDIWEQRSLGNVETGIPTRWSSFNRTFGGITPRMWLIAAYPSQGKSALAQNLVEDVIRQGHEVLWFMYEMDEVETIDRLVTAGTGLDSRKVFFPNNHPVTKGEMSAVSRGIMDLRGYGLHLRCEPTWTLEQIVAETRALKRRNDRLKMVVVDYLQLVPTAREFGNRAEQVAHISRTFKRDVSAANGLAGILLSQLNDEGRTLDSRAPNQDASNILCIEQGGRVQEGTKLVTKSAGLRAVKNRNGKRGDLLPIRLNGAAFTFEEYSPPPEGEAGSDAGAAASRAGGRGRQAA